MDARHPVLLLRGTEPIGNKIELNQSATALVISGPNAGGKTIVLKTAGLFALMAKHAIPLPTRQGARVDFMQVMADIGDMQSVSGDLSTFSGHLVVCREMLTHAQSYKGHSLVLLDEIGTGTDPAQGAALAQVRYTILPVTVVDMYCYIESDKCQLKNWLIRKEMLFDNLALHILFICL